MLLLPSFIYFFKFFSERGSCNVALASLKLTISLLGVLSASTKGCISDPGLNFVFPLKEALVLFPTAFQLIESGPPRITRKNFLNVKPS